MNETGIDCLANAALWIQYRMLVNRFLLNSNRQSSKVKRTKYNDDESL